MSKIIRQSFRKGLLFAIIMIFIMMIGFHAITATLVSKAFGVNVLRGAIPEVRFMLITHLLFGIWAGWSAASKNGKKFVGILEGTITGFSAGFFIALFGLLLNWFIQSGTEVREYLSQLSVENMSYFLLDKGWLGSAYLLILYTVTGFAGSLLAVIMRSDKAKNYWETLKSTVSKTITRINDSLPSVVRNYGKYVFYAVLLIALYEFCDRFGWFVCHRWNWPEYHRRLIRAIGPWLRRIFRNGRLQRGPSKHRSTA